MRVGVLGASGFVGRHLTQGLQARGDSVLSASIRDVDSAAGRLRDCEVIVNLAGEPVAQRWSADAKRKIEESRTTAVAAFLAALAKREPRVTRYVSASAVGYYGTSKDQTFVEEDAPGSDFLARVCARWEREAQRATDLGMRVACVRTGLALGPDGGALKAILPPFRLGGGGRLGSGRQWHSWIHVDDVVGIYCLAIDGTDGALNATAPNPVRNSEFTKALGKTLHRPTFFPVPAAALSAVLGEGAYVLTEGQRVLPQRALALGYHFVFQNLENALNDVLHKQNP